MRNDVRRKLAVGCIAAIALGATACQSGGQNNAGTNAAAGSNSAAAEAAAPEDEFAAMAKAQNATGPVAMPSDAQLPQACQAYIGQIQACIDKVRASGRDPAIIGNIEKFVRARLHQARTAWPLKAQSGSMEQACTQSAAEIPDECE